MKANLKIVAGVGAAMLFAASANAAVLTADKLVYSKEGMGTSGNVTLPVINAVLAADYSADDRIAVTIAGASVIAATDLSATMTCNNDIVVGLLNRSGNTLNFRVNQVGILAENRGAQCTIGGIQVTRSSIASSTLVTATYAAKTALGETIDTGCATPGFPGTLVACSTIDKDFVPNYVVLAEVVSQFSAGLTPKATKFDGVIDVEQDREVFVDGVEDDATFTFENDTTLEGAVEGVALEMMIIGDFSWAANDDGDCVGDGGGAVVSGLTDDVELATDCSSVTITYGDWVGAGDDIVVFVVPGTGSGVKLSPQSFKAEATFAWDTKSVMIPFSAGAWTINGALVFVPYMPYGDLITQIVYISNRGTQNAAITIDAFDEAGASYTFDVGTVSGGTVRKLAQELLDGLTLGGFVPPGKVAFEITVNAPDKDIDVYSAYNVNSSDRGTVVNSQNGKALGSSD